MSVTGEEGCHRECHREGNKKVTRNNVRQVDRMILTSERTVLTNRTLLLSTFLLYRITDDVTTGNHRAQHGDTGVSQA